MKYNNSNNKQYIKRIALTALLFAMAVVLMFVESMIPPIPTLPPGVKLGLSNIVIMYALFFLDKKTAFTILLLKTFFVLLTRGVTAFLLSFSGGICSFVVMILFLSLKKYKLSYIILSIGASLAHNMAQLLVSSLLLKTVSVFYYSPILIVSGVFMGILTGVVLRILVPEMKRINA